MTQAERNEVLEEAALAVENKARQVENFNNPLYGGDGKEAGALYTAASIILSLRKTGA